MKTLEINSLLWDGKVRQALSIINSEPDDILKDCYMALANALLHRKKESERILESLDIHKLNPKEYEMYLDASLILEGHKNKNVNYLKTQAENLLKIFPKSVYALYYLGQIFGIRKEYDKSILFFKQVKSMYPNSDIPKYFIAQQYFRIKNYKLAITELSSSRFSLRKILTLASCYLYSSKIIILVVFFIFLLGTWLIGLMNSSIFLLVLFIFFGISWFTNKHLISLLFLGLIVIQIIAFLLINGAKIFAL